MSRRARLVKKGLDWVLFGLTLVYLLTGLGITQFRMIEEVTFGLLSRSLSFRLHEELLMPFLVLLSIHVLYRPIRRAHVTIIKKLRLRPHQVT